ncbi:DSBA oxidoreductase [Candidatus Vecturithrix granuli]|uniref:DSBA oxidoreductase n=1 Tax=Vecturithrix granuli TaxID=1499967 RepID=A0A081BZ74_VECG1|nr:DSBA oxidoreductase [Candidatus Vecturithrix granuli]
MTQKELIGAIILAAVLISASLVFVALQMRPSTPQQQIDEVQLSQRIKEDILAELKNGEFITQQEQIDEVQLSQRIKEDILTELKNGEFIRQQVDAGVERYIQKQREAQIKAREEQERAAREKAKNVRPVDKDRDHIYGNPDAVISFIEYSDFECPYCKTFHLTAKKIIEAYNGKVNWVYRHYPLQFHNPGAQKQAEASECAAELGGNEAFWKYSNFLYERTTSNGKGFPLEQLAPLAEEIGLDKQKFQECLDSGKYTERVQNDLAEGANSGISGTPGTILRHNKTGEVKLMTGAQPFDAFKAELDRMLQNEQ